jgi:RimJ/RimL family protein N-acetyltransferase
MKDEEIIIHPPEGVTLRYTDLPDGRYLKEWLMDPAVDRWFPMADETEIDDAVARWVGGFYRWRCSLTAVKDDIPIGLTTLYLQPYKKLAHQCEFGIIVSPKERSKGVGAFMLSSLMTLAKETFKIELLHLQVYAENPAIRLYTRFGFKEFGRQQEWLKELDGRYRARIFMERRL